MKSYRSNAQLFARLAGLVSLVGLSALSIGCGARNTGIYQQPTIPGYPGGTTPGIPGGCMPISQMIGLSAQGVYFDSANLVGGRIPSSAQTIGQVVVTGAQGGGPYQRSGSDGAISLNIISGQGTTGMPYNGYPQGTYPSPYGYNPYQGTQQLATVTGAIQLSQLVMQDISYKAQMGMWGGSAYGGTGYNPYGYNPYAPMPTSGTMGPCISGIAFNLGHYYTYLYGGYVYLYFNGSQSGYTLYF